MSVARALRSNSTVVASIAAFEMGAAWLITHAVIQIWIAPIRSHPEGAAVLFSHGSRGFLDFLRLYPDYARRALRWAGILIAVYGAMSLAAAAVLPSALAKPHGQSVVASWRNGLRVSPRVAVIGTISAVAAILAIAGALLAMWLISGTVANMPNARTADLLCAAGALPSVAVLLGIRLWSDVAVAHVAAAGQGVYAASASALRALRNEGRSLAGAYLMVLALSSALLVVGLAGHPRSADEPFGFHVAVALGIQQLCVALRIVVRAGWFAYLTARVTSL